MTFDLMVLAGFLPTKQAAADILRCNALTEKYGLKLTAQQAAELVETRSSSLKETGRIEFGGGVIDKIIKRFCDSLYLSQYDYAETLHELTRLFYTFKNETLDLLGDDDLIGLMRKSFDKCSGSLDLLANRELEAMAHNIRYGYGPEYRDTDPEETEDGEDGEY